jgi:DNA transposition AAA+ family ATPase
MKMETSAPGMWVVGGVIALFSNVIAVIVGAFLTSRNAKRAQDDAVKAQIATTKAAELLAIAQKEAASAIQQGILAAQKTDDRLGRMENFGATTIKTAQDTNDVAHRTHTIVNSQRTLMLRALLALSRRVAIENPTDSDAQLAVAGAEKDLSDAEAIEKYLKV